MIPIANTFATPVSVIAREALDHLFQYSMLPTLVHRDVEEDFTGTVGDTVNVRKPATFTAEKFVRANGITVQDATEGSVPVQLTDLVDVSFAVTAEEATLEIDDFSTRLIQPAVNAIIKYIETMVIGLFDDVTNEVGTGNGTSGDPREDDFHETPIAIADARRVLDTAEVPDEERFIVYGPLTQTELILSEQFSHADKSGTTAGLRRAALGDVYGFETYKSVRVPPPAGSPASGDPTTEVNCAFHRSAFALALRVPERPRGIAPEMAEVVSDRGFGLRVVQSYNSDKKQDVISIDVLAGAKTLDATRACLIKGADAA